MRPPARQRGFTLVEMAVVLALFGLLVGGTLVVVSAQQEQQRIRTTEQTLRQAAEALLGFALATDSTSPAYLPCPADPAASGNDVGREARSGGTCNLQDGWLPWVTLGMGDRDGWSQRIWYRVDAAWSNATPGIGFNTDSGLGVIDREANGSSCTGATPALAADQVPVVLRSTGASLALDPANASGVFFCSGPRVTGFDDIVQWVSPHLLKARLLAAGRL